MAKKIQLLPNWLQLQLHLKLASTLRWLSHTFSLMRAAQSCQEVRICTDVSSDNCKQREHKTWNRKKPNSPHHSFPTSPSQLLSIHMLRSSQTFPKFSSFQCSAPSPGPFLLAPRRCSVGARWGCHGPVPCLGVSQELCSSFGGMCQVE